MTLPLTSVEGVRLATLPSAILITPVVLAPSRSRCRCCIKGQEHRSGAATHCSAAAAFTDGFVRCRSFTSTTAVSVDVLASDCGLFVSGHQWELQLNVENNKEGTDISSCTFKNSIS